MTIGITGARGVIGSIISQKLSDRNIAFNEYSGDIVDYVSLNSWIAENGFTHLIHLASKVAINEVNKSYEVAYDVNINGTIQLLKAIKNYNKKLFFFYASSSHVYKSTDLPIKESDELIPMNTYGLTKYISEIILNDYAKHDSNLNLCIGRIFSFYHESQKPPYLFPTIKSRLQTEDLNIPFKLMGAESVRDFLNAEKVCDLIIQLCEKKGIGTFNIASGKGTKIIDFVKNMSDKNITIEFDKTEQSNTLVADITKLKTLINE